MKTKWLWVICLTIFVCYAQFAFAFDSGSTGADGDFAPTTNTALQIPESGIFNFGSVTIPSGVTVTFKKNSKNTPVTILATGDVVINGTISVNGSGGNYIIPGAGGPGGFDGGQGGVQYKTGRRGEGTGGGGGGTGTTVYAYYSGGGGGGSFSAAGNAGSSVGSPSYPAGGSGGSIYGNEGILPLIGGSGGGGGGGTTTYAGGAGGGGGGAIVIASSGTITVAGTITANGGNGANGEANCAGGGGGGSGGSIRLIANTIAGNGTISATGTSGGSSNWAPGGSGGTGRIRFEASTITRTTGTSPAMSIGNPYAVVPQNLPTLAITSVGSIQVPAAPKGAFGAPDVILPFNTQNPVTVALSAVNVPVGTTVTVKSSPAIGTTVTATGTLAGTYESSSVSVQLNVSMSYPSVLTASVTLVVTAALGGPIYAEGELVEKIRVETAMGSGSTMTYITVSGREIPVKKQGA